MTKENLIEQLQKIPGNPIIKTFDPDMMEWLPITGFTYDKDEVKLYTDEN